MRSLEKQCGAGFTSMLFYFLVGGFVITCLLSLGPHYIDNYNVQASFEKIAEEMRGKDRYDTSDGAIRDKLQRYFQVSRIDKEILNQVEILREDGDVILHVEYEKQQPLIGNIDVVIRFDNSVNL